MKETIFISKCLLGEKVRYDGDHCSLSTESLKTLKEKFILKPICPELEAGMGVPRKPIERRGSQIIDQDGVDYFDQLNELAKSYISQAESLNIHRALLKEESPSCGVKLIYDGSFSGKKIEGMGLIAQRFKEAGIKVFSEQDYRELLN